MQTLLCIHYENWTKENNYYHSNYLIIFFVSHKYRLEISDKFQTKSFISCNSVIFKVDLSMKPSSVDSVANKMNIADCTRRETIIFLIVHSDKPSQHWSS